MTTQAQTYTTNEIDVLNGIAYHEMSTANGQTPETIEDTGCFCWVEDFSKTLTGAQVKGVLASLIKKGLITIQEHDENDTVANFTEAGFAIWQANDQGTNR